MPHLTLEYSSNVKEKKNLQPLFHSLHTLLAEVAHASMGSCKSRAIEHKLFFIGNGEVKNAFVHLEIQLAEGRSLKVRKEAGQKSLDALEQHFVRSLQELNLQVTVKITEFPQNLYFKIPSEGVEFIALSAP